MEPVQPVVKQSSFLITLLSVLLLISVFIAGFFAYQTQNLVKDITKLKTVPTPIATDSPDPTADWKTYTNDRLGFSFRVPNNLDVENEYDYDIRYVKNKDILNGLEIKDGIVSTYTLTIFNSYGLEINNWLSRPNNYAIPKESVNTTNYSLNGLNVMIFEAPYDVFLLFKNQDKIFSFQARKGNNLESKTILSTFKFIEPVACTMEAKICPDGSSIGRSGPKCEFAPCPTAKPVTSP